MNAIAPDPKNPGVVYAGTEFGEVYKSVNYGDLWQPMNAGLVEGASIQALAVDPQDSNRLYALTFQSGIFVWDSSVWTKRSGSLAITAERSNFVFGAPGTVHVHAYQGVFSSLNSGMTWDETSTGLPEGVTSLASDSSDPSRLVAGHYTSRYFSRNAGATWDPSNGNLAEVIGDADGEFPVDDVAIFGAIQYALVGSSFENPGGLFKSEDDGATYTALLRFGDPDGPVDPINGINAYSARVLRINAANLNNILVGTGTTTTGQDAGLGILSTTTGGAPWTSSGPVGTQINAIEPVYNPPLGDPAWYATTSGAYDGLVATVPLDGSAPTTEIIGGTGEDELISLGKRDPTLGLGDYFFPAAGNSSSVDLELTPGAAAPTPASIPPGPVIPPVEPQSAIVLARPNAGLPLSYADLSITKQLLVGESHGRTGVVCTIEVTNNSSTTTATSVFVGEHGGSFTSPVDTTHTGVPASSYGGGGNILALELGDIAPGTKKQIELFYPVYDSDGADLGQTRFNLVQVFMAKPGGNNVLDPVASNDTARAEVTIPQTPPSPFRRKPRTSPRESSRAQEIKRRIPERSSPVRNSDSDFAWRVQAEPGTRRR